MLRVGPYELEALETGRFGLDGGAMFGVVPRVLWEKSNPPDSKNRIEMALRCLLIRGNGRVILVDSGIGEKWNDKTRAMYAIDHSRYQLDRALQEKGLSRKDVTDVIITHLHFDHVGGTTSYDGKGGVELTFPNAKCYIQKANLGHAHAPTEKDRASFIGETIEPLEKSGRLVAVEGNFEFAPGVTAWVTEGHTPGQQLVKVTDGKTTVLCCGDTIPTASHVPIPWVMAYDLFPLTTMAEKKEILSLAVKEGWHLFWVHDPFVAASTVKAVDKRYVVEKSSAF